MKTISTNSRLITSREEELCALAEEIGHIKNNAILPVNTYNDPAYYKSLIAKNEQKATCFAIKKLVPASRIQMAIDTGYKSSCEIAEFCGVTEMFIEKALAYYKGQQVEFLEGENGGGGGIKYL